MNSPLGLLEELYCDDPWKMLISTILLNRTRRNSVDRILYLFLQTWPTPKATMAADVEEISNVISSLGLQNTRAKGILRFCEDFLNLSAEKEEQRRSFHSNTSAMEGSRKPVCFEMTRSEVENLHGCKTYAADAYMIFIQQDWMHLKPEDYALRAYVQWKRSQDCKNERLQCVAS
jgi:methyl-CpG-binding domain protein 4